MDVFAVILAKEAKRNLLKAPAHIVRKLQGWIEIIENDGLIAVKKIPGYHDEPLKGQRISQRSIRLSRSYRAIYIINKNGKLEVVEVLEVNKHAY